MSEEDIRQLIALKTETKNLDYKESFKWASGKNDQKLEIVKDILAMANTQDGGKIIFGVRDSDYDFVEMSEEDYESFDQTKVNDLLHNYTEPKHSCQVYKHKIDGKRVVVIHVPEFAEVPIICKKDEHSSDDPSKQILKKGQIYIRTDKATTQMISSTEEMRELLGRALVKKGDELLGMIERLIKGKPLKPSEDSKEKYDEEIKEAEAFLSENIGEELKNRGHWAVYVYPTEYNPNRISDQRKIKELIQRAEVNLSGWPFPHTHNENATNFSSGRQSYSIDSLIFKEGYQAYKSGLFMWKGAFWEDVHDRKSEDGRQTLSYPYAILLITELFLFLKRYYEQVVPDADLHVKIVLNNTAERTLVTFERSSLFGIIHRYTAKENTINVEDNIKIVELRASAKDIASQMIRQIFLVFNWDDVSEAFIERWQTKLIEGKA